jgi:hypothetical protein
VFSFGTTSNSRLNTVNPLLQRVFRRAIQLSPIDFGIPTDGGLRTAQRQHELFVLKKSMCDGYIKKSYHQSGNALDVYAYVDGKASWEKEHLAIIAAAVLQAAVELGIKVEWGGLWTKFVDMPHFQLPKS